MDVAHKLEVLKDTYSDEAELGLILGKLLDVTLSQHRLRLERYERDLREFEERYTMESATFHRRAGLGMKTEIDRKCDEMYSVPGSCGAGLPACPS